MEKHKKTIKIVFLTLFLILVGNLLYTTNQIDKKILKKEKIELEIKNNKEEIKNVFLDSFFELRKIINSNESLAKKMNSVEEFDSILYTRLENSNLSKELKNDLKQSLTNKTMEKIKAMAYGTIYITEGLETLDSSYIDLAEKQYKKINIPKINEKSEKYISSVRKVIEELKNNDLSEETYKEALYDEKDFTNSVYNLSGGILD